MVQPIAAWRAFVGRANAARRRLVEAERPHLAPLPPQRAGATEETLVTVTRSSGFWYPSGEGHGSGGSLAIGSDLS